jgi:hypothetical protein
VPTDRNQLCGGYRLGIGALHVLQIGGFGGAPRGDGEEETVQHLTQLDGMFECRMCP